MILFFFPVSPQGRVGGRVKSIIDYMYIHAIALILITYIYTKPTPLGFFVFLFFFSFFLGIIYPCCLPSALSLSQA